MFPEAAWFSFPEWRQGEEVSPEHIRHPRSPLSVFMVSFLKFTFIYFSAYEHPSCVLFTWTMCMAGNYGGQKRASEP